MSLETTDPFSKQSILEYTDLFRNHTLRWPLDADNNILDAQYLCLAHDVQVQLGSLKSDTFELCIETGDLKAVLEPPPIVTSRVRAIEQDNNDDDSDVWNLRDIEEHFVPRSLVSWDSFINGHHKHAPLPSFCEAGPAVFDSVLATLDKSGPNGRSRIARVDLYRDALKNLLVGRESAFFGWDSGLSCYTAAHKNVTASGFSPEAIGKLSKQFCEHGTRFRQLQAVDSVPRPFVPSLQTIGSAAHSMTLAIEEHLEGIKSQTLTILQLSSLRNIYADILTLFDSYSSFLQKPTSEINLLATFIQTLDARWQASQHLHRIIECLVARTLDPVLAQTTLSLQTLADSDQSSTSEWKLSGLLEHSNNFFAQLVDCSRLLVQSDLFSDWAYTLGEPHLVFSYTALEEYTRNLARTEKEVLASQRPSESNFETTLTSNSLMATDTSTSLPFDKNFALFDHQLDISVLATSQDELQSAVLDYLTEAPKLHVSGLAPVTALDLCVQPYLNMQLNIQSYVLLQSLFVQYDLVAELHVLKAFELLGDRTFMSYLSTALFSSETTDARRAGSADLPAGLRLEDREAWPPASSELRLALLNVMLESTDGNQQCVMDGRVSFSIRDLSEEELERCREARSIHALDFLRISYTPVNALVGSIISPRSLDTYDRIFRYLLVLLRCKSMTQRLAFSHRHRTDNSSPCALLESKLFAEMNHFMAAMLDYALTVAIQQPWTELESNLIKIQTHVRNHDYEQTLKHVRSLDHLRDMHETALEEILSGLMLKQKQAPIHALMVEIFSMILQSTDPSLSTTLSKTVQVYDRYKHQVGTVISQIEDLLSSTKSLSPGAARLECLITKLDLFGYYQRDNRETSGPGLV